jgi:hypothetical protein
LALVFSVSYGNQGHRQRANEQSQLTELLAGARILSVGCILAGTHTFTCHDLASDGSQDTVTATVTADGSSWITSR